MGWKGRGSRRTARPVGYVSFQCVWEWFRQGGGGRESVCLARVGEAMRGKGAGGGIKRMDVKS